MRSHARNFSFSGATNWSTIKRDQVDFHCVLVQLDFRRQVLRNKLTQKYIVAPSSLDFSHMKLTPPSVNRLLQVVVKESGCSFKFDFAKVYWNSRLQVLLLLW